jgi:hypothetical protein
VGVFLKGNPANGNQITYKFVSPHAASGSTSDSPGRSPFVGPFEGFRRRDRGTPRTPEKNPSGKKPAAAKSEPVTKN